MKTALLGTVALLAASIAPLAAAQPVLYELFTSEGCSYCPAAEAIAKDHHEQALAGTGTAVVLEWHVQYFDRHGWKDRFGLPIARDRQVLYGKLFRGLIGTPQAVLGGTTPADGRDRKQIDAQVAAQSNQQGVTTLRGATAAWIANACRIEFTLPAAAPNSALMVCVTEDKLTTEVKGGENKGKTLTHNGVVRAAATAAMAVGANRIDLPIPAEVVRAHARAVVVIQDRGTLAVQAIASIKP